MRKKSRFDQTRRARWSRVIFQQVRKVLSGKCHSVTTRSLSSASRSCEQEFAFRRLLAAFRVFSSSVLRSCNHEFAFRYHLAPFQLRVRVLPSSSSVLGFATTKTRFVIRVGSLSNHAFTSSSSISGQ